MVTLIQCSTTAQSGEVKSILDDEGIAYEISQDGLTFSVDARMRRRPPFCLEKMIFLRKDLVYQMYLTAVSAPRGG